MSIKNNNFDRVDEFLKIFENKPKVKANEMPIKIKDNDNRNNKDTRLTHIHEILREINND